MQRQHSFAAQLAAAALIRLRRIGKTIAEHDLTLGKPRLNDLGDVLRPRREHQSQFGERCERGSFCVEQKLANLFAGRRAARFPRHHHGQALCTQDRGQLCQLSALAASVETFEGDESAAMRVGGHGKHHSKAASVVLTSRQKPAEDPSEAHGQKLDQCQSLRDENHTPLL